MSRCIPGACPWWDEHPTRRQKDPPSSGGLIERMLIRRLLAHVLETGGRAGFERLFDRDESEVFYLEEWSVIRALADEVARERAGGEEWPHAEPRLVSDDDDDLPF
jgi:hypothetical protein